MRVRRGEDPRKMLAIRQPLDLKITGVPAVSALSGIKIPELRRIPDGEFLMGSKDWAMEEAPVIKVEISAFDIGKFEVTNEEYLAYLMATGKEIPELVADLSKARHPVVNVSWYDAVNYCEWLSEITGRNIRLLTEAEREYAARGIEGKMYPWGDKLGPKHLISEKATIKGRTDRVDAHPKGVSPFGIWDMSGNVWEWVADWYDRSWYEQLAKEKILKNPQGPKKGKWKVLRGGSCLNSRPLDLHGAGRYSGSPKKWREDIGFRVGADL